MSTSSCVSAGQRCCSRGDRADRGAPVAAHRRRGAAARGPGAADREPDRPGEPRISSVAAHALALEQHGHAAPGHGAAGRAAAAARGDEMTLRHQWLPDLVRLAPGRPGPRRPRGQRPRAPARPRRPPRRRRPGPPPPACAAAACSTADPDPLREAVAHYRTTGPAAELPVTLEDLAVVLAGRGAELAEARAALGEAVPGYCEGMRARWDIRRAESLLRPARHPAQRPRTQRRPWLASGRLGGTHSDRGQDGRAAGPGRLHDDLHRPPACSCPGAPW